MRLSKIVLASAAALALSLSLGACSSSINGSDPRDSGSPAVQSEQKDTQGANSKDSPKTDTKGTVMADFQSSSGGPAQVTAAFNNKDDSKDDNKGGNDASITDLTRRDIQSIGQCTEVSSAYIVQGTGTTPNLVDDFDTLTVQDFNVKISAEDADTLTVQGSNITVYTRDVDHLNTQGSSATVHWPDDGLVIQDGGADDTTGKFPQ